GGTGAAGPGGGRGAALDSARTPLARSRFSRLRAMLPGRRPSAGRGLSSGNRLALARGPVRRGLGPRTRRHGRGAERGPGSVPRAAPPSSRGIRARTSPRDRGRRSAPHPARLSLPGLVGGGGAPPAGGGPRLALIG